MRQTDAGVARGALDDGATGPQRAALLVLADHPQRGAILDGSAGIEEFGLAENVAAGPLRQGRQPDQRGVADGAGECPRVCVPGR